MDRVAAERTARAPERVGQRTCKIVGGECAAEEACQRDRHLDGREESCGILGQLGKAAGFFVALLLQLGEACLVYGKHRNFGAGEKGVQPDQNDLQQKL